MPLVLGLASSHAPSLFVDLKQWPAIYGTLTRGEPRVEIYKDILDNFVPVPQPPAAQTETTEVLQGYLDRINRAFAILRDQLKSSGAEVLIIFGDDQGEYLNPNVMSTFCVFLADEITGTQSVYLLGEAEDDKLITLQSNRDLAGHLVRRLVESGFDIAWNDGKHSAGLMKRGLGHAFCQPLIKLMPKLDLPVIPIHVNAYFDPLPTGRRCFELGKAVARALAERPEKVAIYGSGGLSHDPFGPRSGWIDKELDRWMLDQLSMGKGENLCELFKFDSDTLRGGTGEVRSWIAVAGACDGVKAQIIDYIPAHHSVTGLGFAYWPGLSQ
jgi:hypothetical protein